MRWTRPRGDTRQARDTTPRYQHDADRLLAEARLRDRRSGPPA